MRIFTPFCFLVLLFTPIASAGTPAYVLSVVSSGSTEIRIFYSKPVVSIEAMNPANYSFTVESGSCGAPTLSFATLISSEVYSFATSNQTSGCGYRLTVTGSIHDLTGNLVGAPVFGTFSAPERLRVVSAKSLGEDEFILRFSKPVHATDSTNPSLFSIAPALGSIVAFTPQSDSAAVQITHSLPQNYGFYSIVVSEAFRSADGSETIATNPGERTHILSFYGLGPTAGTHGPAMVDAFIDNNPRALVFEHAGKVFVGPNSSNSALFRFEPDGKNLIATGFKTSSSTGTVSSFGANLLRPSRSVMAGSPTRYNLPVPTDLSPFSALNPISISGCLNAMNNRAGQVASINDVSDFVNFGTGGVTSTSESCQILLNNNAGPFSFDGVEAFVPAVVDGSNYLLYGCNNINPSGVGFKEIYFTRDVDGTLDNDYCDLSAITLGNTQTLQSIYGNGSYVYTGFSADTSGAPRLGVFRLTAINSTCASITNLPASQISYLGRNSPPNSNSAPIVGIDSMVVFNNGTGDRLYIANNGGVASTPDIPPTPASTWTVLIRDSSGFSGTTRTLPRIGPVRPGEKGIPFMLEWGGSLFVARNRSNNEAELWKYNSASGWIKVIDTTDPVMNANVASISLLAVVGSRLYIGFDNLINGAQLLRTRIGITDATFSSASNLEIRGTTGIGPFGAPDLTMNKVFFSNTTTFYENAHHLFFTVGCDSSYLDGGSCDRNPLVGLTDFAARVYHEEFTFPGTVPDGNMVSGTPLQIVKSSGGNISLSWANACTSADMDYEIYEGAIGSYFSHSSIVCSTGGNTQMIITPGSGLKYYLVIPSSTTNMIEGSYGFMSGGAQRPIGTSQCMPQELSPCP